jgi:hypothetical protein
MALGGEKARVTVTDLMSERAQLVCAFSPLFHPRAARLLGLCVACQVVASAPFAPQA